MAPKLWQAVIGRCSYRRTRRRQRRGRPGRRPANDVARLTRDDQEPNPGAGKDQQRVAQRSGDELHGQLPLLPWQQRSAERQQHDGDERDRPCGPCLQGARHCPPADSGCWQTVPLSLPSTGWQLTVRQRYETSRRWTHRLAPVQPAAPVPDRGDRSVGGVRDQTGLEPLGPCWVRSRPVNHGQQRAAADTGRSAKPQVARPTVL